MKKIVLRRKTLKMSKKDKYSSPQAKDEDKLEKIPDVATPHVHKPDYSSYDYYQKLEVVKQ